MQPLYSKINMNTFPGEMKLKGKTLVQQAKGVGYRDIFRDIQAMREAAYKKEVARGEFSPEFSGLGDVTEILNNKWAALVIGYLFGWFVCKRFRRK